ncbi:hypothetical protein TL16_g05015 [Triparma laevis f. inornata]|uniref:Uncharacterized protein n=1 Tax=Triparma laevis f. inornata TaxID=1714386 RepID=A0A9W7E5D1_9STRA|nr:hypothetical protein TL16_g05015 [Triparma laevis f. inornata]
MRSMLVVLSTLLLSSTPFIHIQAAKVTLEDAAMNYEGRFQSAKVTPEDEAMKYEGRFDTSAENTYRTDWPCARISFGVDTSPVGGSVDFSWSSERVRLNATAWRVDGTIASSEIFVSPKWRNKKMTSTLALPEDAVFVTLRKLTQAAPFGTGISEKLLAASVWEYHGMEITGAEVKPPTPRKRVVEYIGASDTARYCVDGNPDIDDTAELYIDGWLYDNCDLATPGLLADYFDADLWVEAEGGMGLTQNANARFPAFEGKHPLPYFWSNQALLTDEFSTWDPTNNNHGLLSPDLVLVSLGGNDYNHQHGNVPSNETFSAAYEEFMLNIFSAYETNPNTRILSVCGQGSPAEAAFDPDNNRCSPCPHVEDALNDFKSNNPELGERAYLGFVPCDGSVVVGVDDVGCAGHKNAWGQHKVFDHLKPLVSEIMDW